MGKLALGVAAIVGLIAWVAGTFIR